MASPQLNSEDKKDLDKFTKFLALKSAQIIVQSRLGEKVHTQCSPHTTSGADWFNLSIKELPDVLREAKKALGCEPVSPSLILCVDISLKTVEGDTMMLETWNLGVLPDECESNLRVSCTVYNRMGLLLKSLVAVTRVTPAYKLSRRQSPDSYVICYRIYMGEPQFHQLGEGYQQVQIGQLCTPIGTITLKVAYRTKMTISPQAPEKDATIMLKSDHFAPQSNNHNKEDVNSSMSETLKVGAFVDEPRKTELDDRFIIPDTPFSSLLSPVVRHSPPQPSPFPTALRSMGVPISRERRESDSDKESETDGNGNVTPKLNSRACSRPESPRPASRTSSRRSSGSFASATDDFYMVDMKAPFANNNSSADLGTFYKECQQAPPLVEFEQAPHIGESVTDLAKQLHDLEMSAPKYDELLSNLCSADLF